MFAELRAVLDRYEDGDGDPVTRPRAKAIRAKAMTFRTLGELWTTGALHEQYPDQVRLKDPRTVTKDVARLEVLCQALGSVDVADLTLEHAEKAMAKVSARPKARRPGTRRLYAGTIARLMKLAVYPMGLIERSPIPAGFVPPQGKPPAFTILYPTEEARLMGYQPLPVRQRLLYGVLAREGLRVSEAQRLRWRDLDLELGTVRVDQNKTGNPRMWRLGEDVVRALRAHRGDAKGAGRVFAGVPSSDAAGRLRGHLELAGVTRGELHEATKHRRPFRVHDLRGTFVTLALATGRTETWVCDRTGHQSSQMLALYRRQARHIGELELGWLHPLDEALTGRKRKVKMAAKRTRPKNTGNGCHANAERSSDPVDLALATAAKLAAEAGAWEQVGVLARELQARRVANTNSPKVASLDEARARRDGGK